MFYFLILFSICIFGFAAYFTIKLRFKKHLVLPLLAGLFLLLAFGLYKGFDRSSRNSTESKQENTTASTLKYAENSNFSWDKEKFDNLTVGDQDSGLGGISYDDIIAEYGDLPLLLNLLQMVLPLVLSAIRHQSIRKMSLFLCALSASRIVHGFCPISSQRI